MIHLKKVEEVEKSKEAKVVKQSSAFEMNINPDNILDLIHGSFLTINSILGAYKYVGLLDSEATLHDLIDFNQIAAEKLGLKPFDNFENRDEAKDDDISRQVEYFKEMLTDSDGAED